MVATLRKVKVVENHCKVCGKPIYGLPIKIHNLICKECYGIEHYRYNRQMESEEEITITHESYFSIPAKRVA
ncbi:MAG: hypothetical protein HZRFUVUK_000428 [Candidatus Fervidibacterota bacterium]|jgi:ribosome-binding protein aMBF1 (putative translation factor)